MTLGSQIGQLQKWVSGHPPSADYGELLGTKHGDVKLGTSSDQQTLIRGLDSDRLYELFSQIEKEFEYLYASNLALQDKVDFLTERLGVDGGTADKTPLLEAQDSTDGTKNKSRFQLSQKIKTTYKQSTSKLVSSFRTPNPVYSVVRQFRGHRDGVWEVSVSRSQGRQVIATASAEFLFGLLGFTTWGPKGSSKSIGFPPHDPVLLPRGPTPPHLRAQRGPRYLTRSPGGTLGINEWGKSHSSGEEEIDSSEREDAPDDVPDHSHEASVVRNPHLEILQHSEVVTAADWVCQGSQVITASWDRMAVLSDAESGEQISVLSGHDQELTDVHAHPSHKMVLTSSKDSTFRLWDFRGTSMLVNVFQGHTQQVTSAVFAGSDKVVSGSDDRTVKVWDMRNMRSPIAAIRTDSEVNRLAVSQAHNIIAIPHDNRNIRLYDMHGVRIGRLPRNNRQGHARMVCAVAWADNNPICNLFSCGFDRQVLGWMINIQSKE
ncbi:unnamed protein product [Candidula unifasciata]|uniref:WD repeat-containing protein 37 n=1 Tax=Candidula unifasciata TaxID=100452 RepID=A0A8S3YRN1_9EUPU|nr:unnamed protein product [Candidula unifasciata]